MEDDWIDKLKLSMIWIGKLTSMFPMRVANFIKCIMCWFWLEAMAIFCDPFTWYGLDPGGITSDVLHDACKLWTLERKIEKHKIWKDTSTCWIPIGRERRILGDIEVFHWTTRNSDHPHLPHHLLFVTTLVWL